MKSLCSSPSRMSLCLDIVNPFYLVIISVELINMVINSIFQTSSLQVIMASLTALIKAV